MRVEISCVLAETDIKVLKLGILYHLRYTYPVIDMVGYLKVEDSPSLVFIQISLQQYSLHSTKLENLSDPAAEDNQKAILQYYQSKVCPDTVSLYYVYVCPPHESKKRISARGSRSSSDVNYVESYFNYCKDSKMVKMSQ